MDRRVLVVMYGIVALAGAAIAVWWLAQWSGAYASVRLQAGDTMQLESGLTLTVPPGWEAYGSRYLRIPAWIPIGERIGRGSRSELIVFTPIGSDESSGVVAASFYDDGPTGYTVVARGNAILVTESGSKRIVAARTSLAGFKKGAIFVNASDQDSLDRMAGVWEEFAVQGATLP